MARIGGLLDLAEAELGEQRRRAAQLRESLDSYERHVRGSTEHDPSVIRARRECMEAGRAEDIDLQFVVFGSSVVLVEEGAEPDSYALLIRVPVVVEAFAGLFEECRRRGELVRRADRSEQTRRLVELLAVGLKDEAIARHLGVGLRTVRRRVSELVDAYGVQTRFQLGLEIGRRGRLD